MTNSAGSLDLIARRIRPSPLKSGYSETALFTAATRSGSPG